MELARSRPPDLRQHLLQIFDVETGLRLPDLQATNLGRPALREEAEVDLILRLPMSIEDWNAKQFLLRGNLAHPL